MKKLKRGLKKLFEYSLLFLNIILLIQIKHIFTNISCSSPSNQKFVLFLDHMFKTTVTYY